MATPTLGKWSIVWFPPRTHPFEGEGQVDPAAQILATIDDVDDLLEVWPSYEHYLEVHGGDLDAIDPEGVLLSSMEPVL